MSNLNFKTAVIQMRPVPGNIRQNVCDFIEHVGSAREAGAKLVVGGELITTGYMLGDRWENNSFIKEIKDCNEEIRKASRGLVVVWGSVQVDWNRIGEDGRPRKYNAAMVAEDGEWVDNGVLTGWIPKTNLPKYRIFDDARHFYPAAKLAAEMGLELAEFLRPFSVVINDSVVNLALTVCEDLWEDEYAAKPARIYGNGHVDLLIDISSSPWTAQKWHARDTMLRKRVKEVRCPILYVNIVGLQNNGKNLVWFDGGSCLVDAGGEFRWRPEPHKAGLFVFNLSPKEWMGPVVGHTRGIGEIYDAQIAARRAFYAPFPRVVTGLSGGIDSAVDLALNVLALGREKLLAINMPTQFNSKTTKDLAHKCARSLGVEYRVVPIEKLYDQYLGTISWAGYPEQEVSTLIKENIQARVRGSVLAMIAAAEGGVFTCNGNKTEVALNYFTLYGDGAGAAAFLADLWKGQIYELARHINERAGAELIPQGVIDVVPSAELSADQNVDEGKGDPIFYPYHDKLLRFWQDQRMDPEAVLAHLLDGTLEETLGCPLGTLENYFKSREAFVANLEWAWRNYNVEYKRVQLPPGFLASRRAFGYDRRDTIADAYFTTEYYRLKEMYLRQAA